MLLSQLESGIMVVRDGAAGMKLYRFVFDMVDGAAFGGDFTCRALNKTHAWELLNKRLPGASASVKRLVCESFQTPSANSAIH